MFTQQIHTRSIRSLNNLDTEQEGISARNISYSNNKQAILTNINLCLKPGTITSLIGPSGAGKTSLLKILSLLESPQSGKIKIDNLRYNFPLDKKKEFIAPWPKISVVFQQLFLWPHLTLRQNITLALSEQIKLDQIKQKKIDTTNSAHLESLITRFQMNSFIDKYPNQASLGQRQRAALVRALVLKPKYLLLDEITSSQDVEQIAYILHELKSLKEEGIGILLVTHLLHFAKEASDQIIFLDSGEILASGGKELLIEPSIEKIKKFVALAEFAS